MFAGRTIYRAFDLYYPVFALYLFISPVFILEYLGPKKMELVPLLYLPIQPLVVYDPNIYR